MANHRVLVVSDSLGTPIHARGIFNFTCSAVEILNDIGCETYLLVEPPSTGLMTQVRPDDIIGPTASGTRRAIVADVLKHYEGARFRFDWHYADPSMQRLAAEFPSVANFRVALDDADNSSRQITVDWPSNEVSEFTLTQHTRHLALFKGFVFSPFVYSESFRRAYNNLRPVVIDASSFDLILVDTPHYIAFEGIAAQKVMYIIHDFIPLFEIGMGFDWRALFTRKLECTVSAGRRAIYNSETTGRYFRQIFAKSVIDRETVVYPPIRRDVASAAEIRAPNSSSTYLAGIRENKAREQLEWAQRIKAREAVEGRRKVPQWNPSVPYFLSILSDEPRKNIQALVTASRHFVNIANFIVAGEINGNAYMRDRPEDFPNLHFSGYISDAQKFDLLGSCTAFIFPSLLEGFGIPIIEAGVFGVPVICTDIDVFREITHNQATYFDPKDPNSLIECIRGVLADPRRDEKGSELRTLSVRSFSQSEMTKRVVSLLAE